MSIEPKKKITQQFKCIGQMKFEDQVSDAFIKKKKLKKRTTEEELILNNSTAIAGPMDGEGELFNIKSEEIKSEGICHQNCKSCQCILF